MNKLKLLCGLLVIVFLCGCTFVQPPATEPAEPPAPTVTTPPETEPPTEPLTEAPTEPPTEPPTEAPTEPPSTDDDDYNLVFYWLYPMLSMGDTFYICADGSDEWVQLDWMHQGIKGFPSANLVRHYEPAYPLHGYYDLEKVQYNYPGEISDTWTILHITVANWAVDSWDPWTDGMIYEIQRYEGVKITGKDTLLVTGLDNANSRLTFSTTTMVCCTECPEEWLAQWDGVVEEAPSYHGGTEEPWNFHLTQGG